MKRIVECVVCGELFEQKINVQKSCSKKCAKEAERIRALKLPEFDDEVLTPEYYNNYTEEAKERKARTDTYDRDWIVRNQIEEKPRCRCCGELLLVPFQKHYCAWSCYYGYHVKDIKFDKGEINVEENI